jgi:hypothetical protein
MPFPIDVNWIDKIIKWFANGNRYDNLTKIRHILDKVNGDLHIYILDRSL